MLTDQEIIALYFARDEQAIDETGKKYGSYCYTVAQRIVRVHEDAEECVSDTWLRTWNAIPPKRPDILKMFLAKITRNLALNRWEMRRAEKRGGGETALVIDELAECVAGSSSPESEVLASELGASIDAFVRALPERDGNVFLRRYFYNETPEEIAGRYGLTANNVSVILHRVREKLRVHLTKEGYLG